MERRDVVVTLNGRTVGLVGRLDEGELRRAVEEAREARRREVSATAVTFTMEVDTSSTDVVLRLYAAASDDTAFDDQLFERVPVARPAAPAPVPPRRVARPPRLRRPTAPRLVSWLVEGRGR